MAARNSSLYEDARFVERFLPDHIRRLGASRTEDAADLATKLYHYGNLSGSEAARIASEVVANNGYSR